MIVSVDGTPMPGVLAKLSATPGRIRWAGRPLDADGEAIRREVGGPPRPPDPQP
jgi:crotonobetainyl-CoA:carnitine CoA-transferase CaiB-like acyl-CoA transferase